MPFTRAAALDLLRQTHAAGRLAHSYLISSRENKQPFAFAMDLAALVIGAPAAVTNRDVHIAEPEMKSRQISIDQTRDLERELQMRSFSGGRKIAILVDADRMTANAANSFLKTLEEPPNNSLLLLTSNAPEALPDTILSRCISVSLLPEQKAAELPPEKRVLLEALRVFAKTEQPNLATAFRLVQVMIDLLRGIREKITTEHAAALKAEEVRYKQTTDSRAYFDDREEHYKALTESRYIGERFALVDTLMQWWGDVLRQQQNFSMADFPDAVPDTALVAARFDTREALRRFSALEELREHLNRNVQEQLAIEVAFLKAFG